MWKRCHAVTLQRGLKSLLSTWSTTEKTGTERVSCIRLHFWRPARCLACPECLPSERMNECSCASVKESYLWKPQLCKECLYVKAKVKDLQDPRENLSLRRRDGGLSPALSCPQNLAHCSALTKLFEE